MRRSIPFRIGFLSVLSSFVLLLGMFTFTGTASAHTATSSDVNPHIRAFVLSVGSRCVDLEVVGRGFSDFGRADFFAFSRGRELFVDPESIRANGRGRFSTDITICGLGFFHGGCDFFTSDCGNCDFFSDCNRCDFEFNNDFCRHCDPDIFNDCRRCDPEAFFDCRRFFFPRTVTLFAEDRRTGEDSNRVVIRIF